MVSEVSFILHCIMEKALVESLEFYYENAEKDSEYYKMVEGALKKNEG